MKGAAELGYETSIPIEISSDSDDEEIIFNFSDRGENSLGHRADITLLLRVKGIVNDDMVNVCVNGVAINHLLSKRYRSEYIRRPPSPHIIESYSGQMLEFKLPDNLLGMGPNKLSVGLLKRPDMLNCMVIVDDVNIQVVYS